MGWDGGGAQPQAGDGVGGFGVAVCGSPHLCDCGGDKMKEGDTGRMEG